MKKLTLITLFLLFVININAQDSHPIIGVWQLSTVEADGETVDGRGAVWIFNEGGEMKAGRSLTGPSFPVGEWKCDKTRKMLIMESSMDKDFNGEAQVLKINDKELSYKKDGAVLNFVRAEKPKTTGEIPTLSFTSDDFYDGDDYLYPEDSEKLPWSLNDVYYYMKNVEEMIYRVDQYSPIQKAKTDSYKNSYKVKFLDDNTLSIREYSYYQKDYIDMTDNEYPLNDKTAEESVFYPRNKPDDFRVINMGTETITTPSGTYDCYVIEGIENMDEKVKYWMVYNKPGVYAKIIWEGFSYINVYELIEIK